MNCYLCNSTQHVGHCERCHKPTCARHAYDPRDQYDRESWVCGPCAKYQEIESLQTDFAALHPQLKSLSEVQSEKDAA